MLFIIPLWVLIFAVCGLYSAGLDRRHVSELTRTVVAVCGGVMCLIVWDYLGGAGTILFPSRSIPVWAAVYGVAFVLLGRALAHVLMRGFFAGGFGIHNVVIVGTGELAGRIAREMSLPGHGYRIIAAVDPGHDGAMFEGSIPIYPTLESAVTADPDRRIHEIMQADLGLDRSDIARMIRFANMNGIAYRFVPDQYGVYAAASSATTVASVPVFDLRLTSLMGWGAVGKRTLDLIGAAALMLVSSPVLLTLMAVSKVTEPSAPIFYAQERIGKNGRPIRVLKFRSMRWEYCTGPDRPYKTAHDAFIAMGRADLCDRVRRLPQGSRRSARIAVRTVPALDQPG